MEKMLNEVIEELYIGYVENGGTGIFDLGETIGNHGQDPHEVGRYLVEEGLVKFEQFRPTTFVAAISMHGIQKIHPEYINTNISSIISILGLNGGRMSLMEILRWEPKEFQRAFDLAKVLENNSMIDAQYTHNDVIVNLTFRGKQFYENNKTT